MTRLKKIAEQLEDNTSMELPIVDNDMAQRLRNEVKNDLNNQNNTNMLMLSELDEADIRHEKCPKCKYEPLVRKEGFKVCPSCGTIYKMLDGKGYILIG